MTSPQTLSCPECYAEATVLETFVAAADDVEYVRIRCSGVLTILMPMSEHLRRAREPGPARRP